MILWLFNDLNVNNSNDGYTTRIHLYVFKFVTLKTFFLFMNKTQYFVFYLKQV